MDGGGCAGQKFCQPLTILPSQQHEAVRRVPTNMTLSGRLEVARSGPGSIAECDTGVISRAKSSTGDEARLGVVASCLR